MAIQTKLLRVLQERQVRRIGDNKVINVDVRIISATNKSIRKMADAGQFRRDLVYRLDVLRLFLPPLREREADVELLFVNQLQGMAGKNGQPPVQIKEEVFPLLCQYPFRGNIRELRNIAERVFVLHEGNIISAQDVHEALYPADLDMDPLFMSSGSAEQTERPQMQEQNAEKLLGEEERIRQALKMSGGNKGKAAKLLGIDRSTLWRRIKKYEI